MPIPEEILKRDDVFYGDPPLTAQQALDLLSQIEERKGTVLDGLKGDELTMEYVKKGSRMFEIEWGVARDLSIVNSQCILISGTSKGVEWSPFLSAGLIPLAHSHPFHRKSLTDTRAIAKGGVLWNDINGKNPKQDLGARLKIFPSAGDVAFCAANKLAVHIVKTPYCEVFADQAHTIRWIVNYDANPTFAAAPRLSFRIFDVKEINKGHYRASLVAVAGNQDIWRKHDIDVTGGGGAGLNF